MLGEGEPLDVEISLHQDRVFGLPDGVLGDVHVVELLALVKDRRLGRIEILWLARAEYPAAKTHHSPPQIMDRKEQPIPKPRHQRAVFTPHDERCFQEHRFGECPAGTWR